jgi:hypothetical protein
MPVDFKSNQIRTSQLIVSGNNSTNAGLMVYGSPTNFIGGISSTDKVNIGTDVFVFVSGSIDKTDVASSKAITLFGGDLKVSGSLTSLGSTKIGDAALIDIHQMTGSFSLRGNAKLGDAVVAYHQVTGTLDSTGVIKSSLGLSGSLTRLADGSAYLIAGSNVTIISASNGAITINAATSGSSSSPILFTSPSAGKINTTGSLALAGDFGSSYTTSNAGSDVFFYVSGSKGTASVKPSSGMSAFGGDALFSGSAFFDGASGYALINQNNGGVFSLRNKALGGTFMSSVNTSNGNTVNYLEVRPNGAATGSVASIFPGLYAGPANPFSSTDTTFFVSGQRNAKNGITRGAAVFGGDVVTSGSAYLGTNASDVLVVNSLLASDLIPNGNRTRNLGSDTARFANIYTGDLHLRNERGDYTLIEEEDCLTIRFNKNGKRYRFVLEPAPEFDEKL